MSRRTPRRLSTDYQRELIQIADIRSRAVSAERAGTLTQSDIDVVYEALFLRMITSFEGLLERLFFGLLDNSFYSSDLGSGRVFEIRPKTGVRTLVLSKQKYLDWLPFERTLDRAKTFLKNGAPFSRVHQEQGNAGVLADVVKIRNAIAHSSDYANQEFSRVSGVSALPPADQTPSHYLQSMFSARPAETRFEWFASRLKDIAISLCK